MLTSIKNPRIKQIRKLRTAKERRKQQLLLLEGTNLITAACKENFQVDTVFCTPRWQEDHRQLNIALKRQGVTIELVSIEVLAAIATTVSPDGVVAIAQRRSARLPSIEQTQLGIALERLQDPGNLGTIIRTAVGAGVDGLWLSKNSVDLDHLKVLRASVGEWFRLPVAVEQDLAEVIKRHRQQGIQIIAASAQATKSYWEVDFQQPSLIVLGNEGAGLSSELLALADERVKIPLNNGVESLNVAIANALLLYEARRQLSRAT
ncbi:RNA methyltransferase [Myxosarcina sp. GI1]|uniref:TrmH family RNA methyltransferase n=1 Tax=Myxosarcina sp. GI1 TaxID=1541065 RepID=UPI000563EFB6|nr:RNA methyltransferase [Myxosarcina sp. GI1]